MSEPPALTRWGGPELKTCELAHLLFPHGYRVKAVEIMGCLHLKSALTGVASGLLLANPVWAKLKCVGGVAVLDEYKEWHLTAKSWEGADRYLVARLAMRQAM